MNHDARRTQYSVFSAQSALEFLLNTDDS